MKGRGDEEGFGFKEVRVLKNGGRAGRLKAGGHFVDTPVFMPVGTKGSVKALDSADLDEAGAEIVLANTYHLHLRPGEEEVGKLGGIHKFMNWRGVVLTDSGGFQASSLSMGTSGNRQGGLARITDDGVEFKSFWDGSKHFIGPEKAIEIQAKLGADIIMAFDECTPNRGDDYAKEAMARTHRWLVRGKSRWLELRKENACVGALFGIIQGGRSRELRRESARFVVEQGLPGIAIGGESIGSDPDQTAEVISWVYDLLPKDRPLYTMGVGVRPSDLVRVIEAGADMFDCVAPTRLARTGLLYFPGEKGERINIGKSVFRLDKREIFPGCDCYTCTKGYSRGYLHHLYKCGELSYFRLASIHNLRVMIRTVREYANK